jgi:hypothetical protein
MYVCSVCDVELKSKGKHEQTKRHLAMAAPENKMEDAKSEVDTESVQCECGGGYVSKNKRRHLNTIRHLKFELKQRDDTIREQNKYIEEMTVFVEKCNDRAKSRRIYKKIFNTLSDSLTPEQCNLIKPFEDELYSQNTPSSVSDASDDAVDEKRDVIDDADIDEKNPANLEVLVNDREIWDVVNNVDWGDLSSDRGVWNINDMNVGDVANDKGVWNINDMNVGDVANDKGIWNINDMNVGDVVKDKGLRNINDMNVGDVANDTDADVQDIGKTN